MDDDQLCTAIYTCVPKHQLEQSVATVNEIARPPKEHFQEEVVEQYDRAESPWGLSEGLNLERIDQ